MVNSKKKTVFTSTNKQIPLSDASINLQNRFSLITNISSSNITTHENSRSSAPSKGPLYKRRNNQRQNSTSLNGISNIKSSSPKNGSFSTLRQSSKITGSSRTQINPTSSNNLVLYLSARRLTETEKNVLKLGLSFSPPQKKLNKEKFTKDFYAFIRRLKLRDYFVKNGQDDLDLSQLDHGIWKKLNPTWYPRKVRENRSLITY